MSKEPEELEEPEGTTENGLELVSELGHEQGTEQNSEHELESTTEQESEPIAIRTALRNNPVVREDAHKKMFF